MIKLSRRRYKTAIKFDSTPMTDLVFLLLIFFLLSSPFMIQPGIKIKLPKAASAEAEIFDKVIVSITKENKIFVNEKEVPMDHLESEIKRTLSKSRERILIVKADAETSHGMVVEVLDKAKLAGAEKLAIATDVKKRQ
jgi:biopolymer transport protein ExbD